jgi:hypothetical protein
VVHFAAFSWAQGLPNPSQEESLVTSKVARVQYIAGCLLVAGFMIHSASSQTTTYTYTGQPFNSFTVSTISCPPICRISGSFTVSQPIPPNLTTLLEITPISYNFTDGYSTVTDATGQIGPGFAIFSTDANGLPTQWNIQIVGNPSPIYVNGFLANQLDLDSDWEQGAGGDSSVYIHEGIPFEVGEGFIDNPGIWTVGCSIPQPSNRFYQGAANPQIPTNLRNAAVTQITAQTSKQPVPQYFGSVPNPNSSNPPTVLCPTIKSGCALSSAATMLSTFPNVTTTTSLDSEIRAADGYDNGTSLLCPRNGPSCAKPSVSYPDSCEMNWFAPQLVAPNEVDWIDGQETTNSQCLLNNSQCLSDQGGSVTVNQYLNNHVCGHQDRVILQLNEFIDKIPHGSHYVYVTGQHGTTDCDVWDPGWKNAPTTLTGHFAPGFTANGSTRTFTVAGVRTYEDITSTGNPGAVSVTANSPVELLMVDPQGRQLGHLNGTDVFQIPLGSYVRDFPQADPTGMGTVNGDPTGIKTAAVSSPLTGTYFVVVTGTATGAYTLRIRSLGSNGALQPTVTVTGNVGPGSSQTYSVIVNPNSGPATASQIVGDVNGDGVVNCADLDIVKASFGKKLGQAGFDGRADVNVDGIVNLLDLQIVASHVPAGTVCQ